MRQIINITFFFLLIFVGSTKLLAQVNQFKNIDLWKGQVSNYLLENNQLKLNAIKEGQSTISKVVEISDTCIWALSIEYNFSPSSNNQFCIYFIADTADQEIISEGLYLQVGESGAQDALNIFEVKKGKHTLVKSLFPGLFSTKGVLSLFMLRKNNSYSLIVNKMEQFDFRCELDPSVLKTSYIGIWNKYTKSNVAGFDINHFLVGKTVFDEFAIERAEFVSAEKCIKIIFNQSLMGLYLKNLGFLRGEPVDSSYFLGDTLVLSFNKNNTAEEKVVLELLFEDLSGNQLSLNCELWLYDVDPFDVVFTEVMSDFVSNTGHLREGQYIELFNRSIHPVNLKEIYLGVEGDRLVLPNYNLGPSSYVVLMKSKPLNTGYKNVLVVPGWETLLSNEGKLSLYSNNKLVDQTTYNKKDFDDDFKQSGGWSFELMQMDHYCSLSRSWAFSQNDLGGTPGVVNSIRDQQILEPIKVKEVEYVSDTQIAVWFNVKLSSGIINNNKLWCEIDVVKIEQSPESLNKVVLHFGEKMEAGKVYSFKLKDIESCVGKLNNESISYYFGKPESPKAQDIIINEILADGVLKGEDYFEIYNRSAKVIDVSQLLLAKFNDKGSISSTHLLSNKKTMFVPGQYLCFSSNTEAVENRYLNQTLNDTVSILRLESDLNFPANEGNIGLVNRSGGIIDFVAYKESWHSDLLADFNGISLERIDIDAASNRSKNWNSASFDVNHGTPGYKNSNLLGADAAFVEKGLFLLEDFVDLSDDMPESGLRIRYNLESEDYALTGLLYSSDGNQLKVLCENILLGVSGELKFNRDIIKDLDLPASIYVVVFKAIHSSNKSVKLKRSVSIF